MGSTNDLVQSYNLSTVFGKDAKGDFIEHVYDDDEEEEEERREKWYRDGRSLGAGGGSEQVWLERETSGSLRAVKQIASRPGLRGVLSRSRELAAMAKFTQRRRNFVRLLGWFESADCMFIAMEYFPLGDLESRLKDGAELLALSEDASRKIISQVLEGLVFMHSAKFTHRDIKPQNLFVQSAAPNWRIKIGDFGISKKVESNETALRTGDHSPGYGAPEIVNDDSDRETSEYTNAVDIWCVGVTAFRILSAGLPFRNNKAVAKYEEGSVSFPSRDLQERNCSHLAINFVQWLLSVVPRHRPTAEGALRHAWLTSFDTKATSSSLTETAGRDLPVQQVSAVDIEQTIRNLQITNNPMLQASRGSRSMHQPWEQKTISSLDRSNTPPFLIRIQETTHSLPDTLPAMDASALWNSYRGLAVKLQHHSQSTEGEAFDAGDSKPLLWWAVASQDLAVTSTVCKLDGIDVNCRESVHGWSALAKSVIDGDIEICSFLLQQPSLDPNPMDYVWGLTPLMIAAADGNVTLVNLLLRHRSLDINRRDFRWGRTALSWAAGYGRGDVVSILLQNSRIDVTSSDFEGWTPLAWAVNAGNLQVVRLLHSALPPSWVDKDRYGRTLLLRPAMNGHARIVQFLLSHNRELSVTMDNQGHTPLLAAASGGHVNVVSNVILPILGANAMLSNLRWKDIAGRTALIYAAKSGHNDMVHWILNSVPARERGTIIDDVDHRNRTALSWAAAEGHVLVVRTLLQMGSRSTAIPDDQDQVPLHKAVKGGFKIVSNILLRTDPLTGDLKDAAGRTPLSWAAGEGWLEILSFLLTVGADVNSWDNDMRTVACWAALNSHRDCLLRLTEHQDYSPHNPDGHTVVTWIIAKEQLDEKSAKSASAYLPGDLLDFPDARGRTPLSWAAETGNEHFALDLLRSGRVNPSTLDSQGYSPMIYAMVKEHQIIAYWLFSCPDLDQRDKQHFWHYAPKWAVKYRILSKLVPSIRLDARDAFNSGGKSRILRDGRTFEGIDSPLNLKNHVEFLISCIKR